MRKPTSKIIAVVAAASISIAAIADHNTPESLDKRTAPVGTLNISSQATQTAVAAEPRDALTVYNTACMACHGTGAAGAPKLGDAVAWAPRIEKGMEMLIDHAINGFQGVGMMPARGGNPTLTDDEVIAAVEYMIQESQ